MSRNRYKLFSVLATAGAIGVTLAYSPIGQAFNFGDMMSPGKWMGGGDRYDDGIYGAPAYQSAPAPAAPAPSSTSSSSNVKDAEIEALKRRIEELETKGAPPPSAPPPPTNWGSSSGDWGDSSKDWGAAPAFRPMGKY